MNSRYRKLAVESLEGRSVLSTMALADFNNDGRLDLVAITDPNTITVSLATDSGYVVSDILSAPKNQSFEYLLVHYDDSDDYLDILANAVTPSGSLSSMNWHNNGDGTFDYVEPFRWKGPKPRFL